ncbi:MAG: sulfurtransferase [Nannocystis sp.]|nr:sulfurtransferase [Nannocystis sp.]MBA3549066.1 sulfurtransferase [Nannocystis sp.]
MTYTTLISAAELAEHIFSSDWIVLDCRHDLMNPRFGMDSYRVGHLPNAQFAGIDTDLSDKSPAPDGAFRGRHPLPTREDFVDTLQTWGVHSGTQVVAYDAHGGMYAARLWWMLRWVGHRAVAVLDGGLSVWQAHNGTLSTELVSRPRGTITAAAPLTTVVSAADIVANFESGSRIVIDARAPDRYRGENETIDPVGGHIPGAKNRFFKENLQADGRFKPAAELRAVFSELAPVPAAAISQCGSGVTACHNLLAMEIAGLSGAALYPGSWSEWCAEPARPVERG